MSKYLNVFNTLAEYQAFSASTEYVQPNVALVKQTNVLYYDYGNNKPKVDMSDYKVESEEKSIGGDNCGANAITKINYIPSGITSLYMKFSHYKSLQEVTCEIPESVTSMGSTFSFCSSLFNVPEIPSSVENMKETFYYCGSLVNSPQMPIGVSNIDSTFYECRSLVNAPDIPSGITNMGYTFGFCTSLKELTLLPTTPPKYSSTLNGCSSLESIYVPDESVDAYKTATGWSEFADKFKPLSSKPTE